MRRVVYVDQHDYLGLLYGAFAPGAVTARPEASMRDVAGADARRMVGDAEIFHINWPEHLIVSRQGETPFDNTEEGWDERLAVSLRFLEQLQREKVKIVWTVSNRRPHIWWFKDHGLALYKAWARAAHAVVHLSHWGMDLVRGELPFRDDQVHVVIPLGHFGDLHPASGSRRALEEKLGLAPCRLRLGFTGRPQPLRGAPFVMEAFAACSRPDLQLLVTAIKPGDPRPDDPRIHVFPFTGWRSRAEISDYLHVCDALTMAIEAPTYLSSATHCDALGVGIPMVVNDWPYFREILGDAALYFDGTRASLTRLFDRLGDDDLSRARAASLPLRERYTWAAAAEGYRSLFERITDGRFPGTSGS
jgi:glycosyltransferase involved in cell wall biosynthesis